MKGLRGEFNKPKTKIVATIGPASAKKTVLRKILRHISVARINLAHGTKEEHLEMIDLVREVSSKIGRDVSVMVDLPGPKIRLGKLEKPVNLKRGEKVALYVDTVKEKRKTESEGENIIRLPVEFEDFPKIVSKGGVI